ncbi:kinesin-like protein kif15 [Plasmopara halstedii]|uniref:Kinesin-like protein kif15 n=1 Tax=Plasmopara halstedii TaxID=4781 RepID=A0A0P1AJF3_PLAHL|nr:kinesin-like protein kif15 [Plasmopara halstedii]CEG40728.1 kinesin-like protein kif15 [Plasmopara halstedii]|eukprot:XP_024577097.1 kinesin-like protein kif15 [Plasmopara halstedii]
MDTSDENVSDSNVSDTNVKVFCRVRPPSERERGNESASHLSSSATLLARVNTTSSVKKCVTVPASDNTQQTIYLQSKHCLSKTFTFDRVFDEDASQNDVFEVVGAPITRACLKGYNGTIFAYGQTGSGKTFTMQGPDDVIDTEAQNFTPEQLALRGLVPRVFDYLFDNVVAADSRKNVQHTFACSFLEIYNERVYDLLDQRSTKDTAGLQLRESGRKGVHVEGLIESVITNSRKAAELMKIGAQNRRVGQTSMNRESSRSHSVFILQLQSKEISAAGIKTRTSRFNLVDLAGSERQRSTDAAGERLKEAGNINKSLSALGNVILGLSELSVGKHRHVHYRDSKLTFLLKDSLGGNSKTFMVATISPAEESAFETLSTLKFAQRAKMIQNSARVNEDAVGSTLFLQEEVQRLRRKLQQAHTEIARYLPGSKLLMQDTMSSENMPSHDPPWQRDTSYPAIDLRFRELEEAFALSAETNERLQRSCEYLRLQNDNVQALCVELKQNVAHLRLMLRLQGNDRSGVRDYTPSADAIEWRIKYEEVEERVVELEEKLKCIDNQDTAITAKTMSEVENLNMMLLGLSRQLAAVLRDKHDLQDRLLENQSKQESSMEGPSSLDRMDSDFSARLEEALKQQANEFQAKLDSVSAFNACLEEKAAETSLELHQIKRREASWSVQQLAFEKQAADFRSAMLEAEKAQLSSISRLLQEESEKEELKLQLERAREGISLEYEVALADASTANKNLEDKLKLLQQQVASMDAEIYERKEQAHEAMLALDNIKTEMEILEAANKSYELQLSETQSEVEKSSHVAARLRTEVFDREKLIEELRRSEAVITKKSRILEKDLAESTTIVRQLQESAATTTQKHSEAIEKIRCQAKEHEKTLIEDFEMQLSKKDEQVMQLHSAQNDLRAKTEESTRRNSIIMKEMEETLSLLQRQLEDQQQNSKLALEDVEQKLSSALSDISTLAKEKEKIELEYAAAVQQIDHFQHSLISLENEKQGMASQIESSVEHTEQLIAQKSRLENQNAELVKTCNQQQIELSKLEDSTTKLSKDVQELRQQITSRSKEAAELRDDLASARNDLCQASVTKAEQTTKLSNSTAKIEELKQELAVKIKDMDSVTIKLEKAVSDFQDAESTILRQQKQLEMYQGIQSALRDELKKLEFERLELTESLKSEQELKQDVEENFANAKETWFVEKNQLTKQFQSAISALEERINELTSSQAPLLARIHELEQENDTVRTLVVKKDEHEQTLLHRLADKEAEIRALDLKSADSIITQKQTIEDLKSSVHDLEHQRAELKKSITLKEKEIVSTLATIAQRDNLVASLKEQALDVEAVRDRVIHDFKVELEASNGRVQALEQHIAEKTAVFEKTEKMLVAENDALKKHLEGTKKSLAHQNKQSGDKDAALELANKSIIELKDQLAGSSSAKVQELQAALEEMNAKYQSAVAENVKFKEQENELQRRRSELDIAEERNQSIQKALETQQAVVENMLKEAKTKVASQDVIGQVKRKFLTEKVKLQREIQTLTKKLETLSKENEKLVGHHNSRQKIQHHVKVKEENNRLLEQVRQLSDEKFKLQRSLENARVLLKEKENAGIEMRRITSPVSPALSNLSNKSQNLTSSVKSPQLARATLNKIVKLDRGKPTSRSASPRPSKKRRTPTGPEWQR